MRILLPVMFIMLSFLSVTQAKAQPIPYNSWNWINEQLNIDLLHIAYLLELPVDATEEELDEYILNYDLEILETLIMQARNRWVRIGQAANRHAIVTGLNFNEVTDLPRFQSYLESIKLDVDYFHLVLEILLNPPEELPPPEE